MVPLGQPVLAAASERRQAPLELPEARELRLRRGPELLVPGVRNRRHRSETRLVRAVFADVQLPRKRHGPTLTTRI